MIPGLPDRRFYGDLRNLRPQQVYTLLRQLHNAERAGKHVDVRIGNPQLGLFSWAAPKDLPAGPGQKRLLIPQPVHTFSYKDYQGRLQSAYGKGTVKKLQQSPVVILKNTPNKIQFTRADRKNSPIYTLVKAVSGNYLATVADPRGDSTVKEYKKEHFKSIPLADVTAYLAQGARVYPKIDGAGALVQLKPTSAEVYGIVKDKDGHTVRYTDLIGGLRDLRVPAQNVGKILRAQVTGMQNGKPIPASVLAGLLNSTLQHNIQKRKSRRIKLALVALALAGKPDEYSGQKVRDIVRSIGSDKLRSLEPVRDLDDFNKQLSWMRQGKHPLTQQGFVVQAPGKRPLKAKLVQDSDVVVDSVFPARTKAGARAGGFSYKLPGSAQVAGKVGTGFSHQLLRDMLQNPQQYIGRTARISSQGQYPGGAYRAPSFLAFRPQGD